MSEVGPLVVLSGLTSAVHGPCTLLGIKKHTVYLAGFDLGAQACAHLDGHTDTRQNTFTRLELLTSQVWAVMFIALHGVGEA